MISSGMIPVTRPTKVSAPWRNTPMKSSAHWPRVSLMPATGGTLENSERSANASNSFPDVRRPLPGGGVAGVDERRGLLGRGLDRRSQAGDLGPGRQVGRPPPDQGRLRLGVGEDGDPAEDLGGGDAVVGSHRDDHECPSPQPAGRGADRDPALSPQRPRPGHEGPRLLVGEQQLERPEDADGEEEPTDTHARSLSGGSPGRLHAGAGMDETSNTKSLAADT